MTIIYINGKHSNYDRRCTCLNASAFIGGSYLAKTLSGHNSDEERKRHDLALEKYQKDYAVWKKHEEVYSSWLYQNKQNLEQADKNMTDTDYAFKLYSKTHPTFVRRSEPKFSSYYQPSKQQKHGELMYLGAGGLALGVAYHFL